MSQSKPKRVHLTMSFDTHQKLKKIQKKFYETNQENITIQEVIRKVIDTFLL